jgi:hypothetical protein
MTKCDPRSSYSVCFLNGIHPTLAKLTAILLPERRSRFPSAHSGSEMSRPNSNASEERSRPIPKPTPQLSPPKPSSPGSKTQIYVPLRPPKTESDNDEAPEASREELATAASNRDSGDQTMNMLRTFAFQIPEIRRISASTASQASDRTATRAQAIARSDLLVQGQTTLFNTLERGPSDTRYNQRLATDGVSPFDTSSSLRGRRRSSFFSTTLPTTQEEAWKADGTRSLAESQWTRDAEGDSSSSDDKKRGERRGRSVVGSVADDAVAFSAELRRRSSGANEEQGGSSRL